MKLFTNLKTMSFSSNTQFPVARPAEHYKSFRAQPRPARGYNGQKLVWGVL